MVSIKEATERAVAFAREALGPERTQSIRLEEVESTVVGGRGAWLITLSMFNSALPDEQPGGGILGGIALANALVKTKREYKTFTVIKSDGEVESMKIRELADA